MRKGPGANELEMRCVDCPTADFLPFTALQRCLSNLCFLEKHRTWALWRVIGNGHININSSGVVEADDNTSDIVCTSFLVSFFCQPLRSLFSILDMLHHCHSILRIAKTTKISQIQVQTPLVWMQKTHNGVAKTETGIFSPHEAG